MDLNPSKVAKGGAGPRIRQHPWMTDEDAAILNALSSTTAHQFEALIHQQARANATFYNHTTCVWNPEGIDAIRSSNVSHGPGGGRQRGRYDPPPI